MVTIHASSVWFLIFFAFFCGVFCGYVARRKSIASVTHSIGTLSVKLEVDSVEAEAQLAEIIKSLHEIHELTPAFVSSLPCSITKDRDLEARGELA